MTRVIVADVPPPPPPPPGPAPQPVEPVAEAVPPPPSFGDATPTPSFGEAAAPSFGDAIPAPSFGEAAAPSFGEAIPAPGFGEATPAPGFGDAAPADIDSFPPVPDAGIDPNLGGVPPQDVGFAEAPPAPVAVTGGAVAGSSSVMPAGGPAFGGAGIGGISTELLTDERFAEVQSNERVVRQNSRLLKVRLGDDVLAKQGSMVAFQGQIDFDYEGSGAAKFLKKAMTGEGMPLMRCSGQGELFLADAGFQVHIITLEGAGLTVNGSNVLAFEPSLSWEIERIKGGAMMAGGLFNTRIEGHGWVAITTDGDPVVLRTDQPTFADTDAAVAWSSSLTTTLNRTAKAQALIGRGSGEAVQLAFEGEGIVIVQPSEGGVVPPHTH